MALCKVSLSVLSSLVVVWSANDLQSSLISGNSAFGHALSGVLYEDSSTNLWISPFSITSCFSLIYPGSAGRTADQIASTMGYPTDCAPSDVTASYLSLQSSMEDMYDGSRMVNVSWDHTYHPVIGIANRIYTAKDLVLKESYVDALNSGDESFLESDFDFASSDAAHTINEWVSESTDGLIEGIVGDDDDLSNWRLAALNALYLNATFKLQFKSWMTSKQSFYGSMTRTLAVADCHLMHQTGYFGYFSDGMYQYLKFPLSDERLFVLFALPTSTEVYAQQQGLITDHSVVTAAIAQLESTYIALALPKLSIEASYALKTPLTKMGMTRAFTASADFSGISNESLQIDSVIHKSMVEMDENGLVAAAVTAVIMTKSAIVATEAAPVLFKADHSFQMFIVDGQHENVVLFQGLINNPGIPQGSEEPTYNESSDAMWTDHTVYSDASLTATPVANRANCVGRDSRGCSTTESALAHSAVH